MSAEAKVAASGSDTRTLVVERVFKHAPEKLWRALTETDLLEQWMMANDFAPEMGRRFQFRTEPKPGWNGIVDGQVMIVDAKGGTATVTIPNVNQSNGVIHVIDTVLMPAS